MMVLTHILLLNIENYFACCVRAEDFQSSNFPSCWIRKKKVSTDGIENELLNTKESLFNAICSDIYESASRCVRMAGLLKHFLIESLRKLIFHHYFIFFFDPAELIPVALSNCIYRPTLQHIDLLSGKQENKFEIQIHLNYDSRFEEIESRKSIALNL